MSSTTRRSHTKSRNGCKECKRRKVKCDENPPCCFNCSRHGVICSLSAKTSPSSSVNTNTSVAPIVLPSQNFRSYEHNYPYFTINPPSVSAAAAFSNLPNLVDQSRLPHTPASTTLDDDDASLELMHHYCTYTADTICVKPDMRHTWRVTVPEIGFRCKYVVHGLLAVAALHKAHLLPSQRERYLDLSAYYQTLGVQRFVTALQNLDESNWKEAFCFSSTVVIFSWCLPSIKRAEVMRNPMPHVIDMLMFVRGLKAVIVPWQGQLKGSSLSPLVTGLFVVDEKDDGFRNPSLDNSPLPNDVFEALEALNQYYRDTLPESRLPGYLEAVDQIATGAYLGAHMGLNLELGSCMFWIYVVQDDILGDVQAADPFAMVLLSYFAAMLAVVESRFWFLKAWPRILFSMIDENLQGHDDERLLEILKWPRKQVFEVYCID